MARMKTDSGKAKAGAFDFHPFLSVFIRAELGFTGLKAKPFTRDSAFVLFELTSGAFADGV
jgi:hypothetical protein